MLCKGVVWKKAQSSYQNQHITLLLICVNLTYSTRGKKKRSESSELNQKNSGNIFSFFYLVLGTGIHEKFPLPESKSQDKDKSKYGNYSIAHHHHFNHQHQQVIIKRKRIWLSLHIQTHTVIPILILNEKGKFIRMHIVIPTLILNKKGKLWVL